MEQSPSRHAEPVAPIIGVHGFNFDPSSSSHDPWKLYNEWESMLNAKVIGFGWYSCPMTFGLGLVKAWSKGHLHRYRFAYGQLAVEAADALAQKIWSTPGPVQLIGHSLGSRVIIRAARKFPDGKIKRILLLNGAEHVDQVRWESRMPPVLNVVVKSDDVLKRLGAKFTAKDADCIGQAGYRPQSAPQWRNLYLDDAVTQDRAIDNHGWKLQGDAPAQVGDHWFSYRFQGNWPAYRAWVRGTDLSDLTR